MWLSGKKACGCDLITSLNGIRIFMPAKGRAIIIPGATIEADINSTKNM
jgi:hypothetical protein